MPYTVRHLLVCASLGAAMLGSAGCAPKRPPALTVNDLMEDRVLLDGVLLKCDENPEKARDEPECLNARVAIDRLAQVEDPKEEAKRNAEFERSRDQLRLTQDKKRQEQEEKAKMDGYNLPVVPVDSASAGGAAGSGAAAPAGGVTASPAATGGATGGVSSTGAVSTTGSTAAPGARSP